MPSATIRFPVLRNVLRTVSPGHFWGDLLAEADENPDQNLNFSSVLLEVQEEIIRKIERSNPGRWGRKKRDIRSQNEQYRQLDLRFELLIMAKLLDFTNQVQFEANGSLSSPDIQVAESEDSEPIFLELTARTERNPEVLPELTGIFNNQYSDGSLTPTLDQYIQIINTIIERKIEQSRSQAWPANTMLLIDISRYGISWIRPARHWVSTIETLNIDWQNLPFISVSICLTELTSTNIEIGTYYNPNLSANVYSRAMQINNWLDQ